MHAIEVTETGGPEVLKYVDKPRPSPGPGEVLIKAEAIGLNFVDTYFRSGSYPHKLPFVLGAEIGGTVEALADGVTTLRVGDRVANRRRGGAYAEYCVAPANVVGDRPKHSHRPVRYAHASCYHRTCSHEARDRRSSRLPSEA
jgi:NADPH2:quinone reductase